MMVLSRWKVIVVLAALLFGILFTLPNVLPASVRESLPPFLPKKTLNLGLDLQGGSYLLLEVDTAALQKEKATNLVEDVRKILRDQQISIGDVQQTATSVSVRIPDPAQRSAAQSALSRQLPQPLKNGAGTDLTVSRQGDDRIRLAFTEQGMNEQAISAVDQSIEIIRRRVDELGTKEPAITKQGANRIVVQAPGESDPEKLKEVIGQTAKLTFQMVDTSVSLQDAAAGRLPPGSELLPSLDKYQPAYVVRRRAEVSGEMLTDARQVNNPQTGASEVSIRFNSQGARRFGDITTKNVGKPFAIVLDGKVISAPNINSPITGGQGVITGSFTVESANNLAILLRAGALPAPLKVEEQRTVGAELGADAVEAGKISTIVGFVSILVFMLLAYGFLFGGISVIALLVNGLMIIAAMSATQATLTLPGIAGLILTLAVAVDANVLIYERMRDEVRAGRPLLSAMDAGFSRAMETIIDANLTTLIAAAIMFFFGAGPVRGFAWTLSIGVFTSVLTAVLVTQVLLALWYRSARPKTLPIL
ncbi:protein translocase subunit SecD [Caulobacter mirabilis]|uniref:Protein translocase subunit SecD n=1 Tax=Caulobacter mirabilis TaxID=69666 RepID=A0A2D2AWV3_9CAUL|nr:protein translocase subunit SecD [Caulobacter mirabilis]ATQ42473.1 protein translocase subunit SecD [Caulobacter mirabilis]